MFQNLGSNQANNTTSFKNFLNSQPVHQVQSFPPQGYAQQPQPTYQPTPQTSQQQGSFLDKVNLASGMLVNFIKTNNPLASGPTLEAIALGLEDIKPEDFEKIKNENLNEISCLKLEENQLNGKTVISLIQNPKQVSQGFLKPTFVMYDVNTAQFNWIVQRRYSDFIWLRDCLSALFPGEIIPSIPKKKIGNRRLEADFIEKRRKGLQVFLDEVLSHENFKSTDILLSFLSTQDRLYFENQMKMINPDILVPSAVEAIKTEESKVKVYNFENENAAKTDSYFKNMKVFSKLQGETLKNIHTNLKEYHVNVAAACYNLEEIEKNFTKLSMLSSRVNFSPVITNVYEQYSTFFKNWKRIIINQTCIIKESVGTFFKGIYKQYESFNELMSKQEVLYQDYTTKKAKLLAKKEGLWSTMDISKWELNHSEQIDMNNIYRDKSYAFEKMCFTETFNLNKTRNLLGYLYYKISDEFNKLLRQFEASYTEDLKEFSTLFEPTLTDGVNVWSNLSSNVKE